MAFDVAGARRAGYSDAEIAAHLAQSRGFNIDGARQAGYGDGEIITHLTARSLPARVAGVAGQLGAGINTRAAQVAGALPDLYNRGLRAVGLPATPDGAYTRGIQRGINAVVGEPPDPASDAERIARGVGGGMVDAASMLIPATAVARTAAVGSTVGNVAATLAAQPATQIAAGAVGGGVATATGSDLAGLTAALTTPLAIRGGARVVTPNLATPDDPVRARLADAARRENIPLTAGQETGSRGMRNVEAAFATLPSTAGPQGRRMNDQADAFTAAALRYAGIGGTRATPEILSAARRQTGAEIGTIASRNTADFSQGARQQLEAIAANAEELRGTETGRVVRNFVNRILARLGPDGRLPGAAWHGEDIELGKALRGADGQLRNELAELRKAMADAFRAGASPDDVTAFNDARRRYGNIIDIENAVGGPGAAGAQGQLSPAQFASAVRRGDRRGYAEGAGEMNTLARVGETFIRDAVPNSGTAERTLMSNLLTGGGLTGGAVTLGADPVTAAAGVGTLLALPRAAQGVYNTEAVRRWLTNRTLRGVAPDYNEALAAALLGQQVPRAAIPAQSGAP
jgi:hypothetical protein